MITWSDEALIISYRPFGESSAILEIFTPQHGRFSGVVRGGSSRKQRPHLQPGTIVSAHYSARLEEHMGALKVEPIKSYAGLLMSSPTRLAGFQSICAMIKFAMTERDPHPRLYNHTLHWLESENICLSYVTWELILLSETGFQLALEQCTVTGRADDLAFVSPKTGAAVCKEAAGEWADKLLPYSPMFAGENLGFEPATRTLEFFLVNWLAKMIGKHKLPEARARFTKLIGDNAPD